MAGGVSANRRLRERLAEALGKDGAQVIYPAPSLCTDNGAMIAYAGALRLARGERDSESPRFGRAGQSLSWHHRLMVRLHERGR